MIRPTVTTGVVRDRIESRSGIKFEVHNNFVPGRLLKLAPTAYNPDVRWLSRLAFHVRQRLRGKPRLKRPPDPRVDADPWLAALLDEVGERYRLGQDRADGIQVLRRTGKERFNPMRVYLHSPQRGVLGDYDVRIRDGRSIDEGRRLLDLRVSGRLAELGLKPVSETVEQWGGEVITRRYAGECPDAMVAAAAVRFMCEESEQIIDTAAEESGSA
jgi:hypothetical protein